MQKNHYNDIVEFRASPELRLHQYDAGGQITSLCMEINPDPTQVHWVDSKYG